MLVVPEDVVPDRVHEVRLAQPHPAVDVERVVRPRRRLGHCPRRGFGKLVRRPDDEALERVAHVQADAGRGVRRRRGPGGPGCRQLVPCRRLGRHRLDEGRLLRRNRRRGLLRRQHGAGRPVRHELDARAGPAHLGQGFSDDAGVVLRQPVAEHRVGHAHPKQLSRIAQKRTGVEPGVVAVPVDLGFGPGENAIPHVVALHGHPSSSLIKPYQTISCRLSPFRAALRASRWPPGLADRRRSRARSRLSPPFDIHSLFHICGKPASPSRLGFPQAEP